MHSVLCRSIKGRWKGGAARWERDLFPILSVARGRQERRGWGKEEELEQLHGVIFDQRDHGASGRSLVG